MAAVQQPHGYSHNRPPAAEKATRAAKRSKRAKPAKKAKKR